MEHGIVFICQKLVSLVAGLSELMSPHHPWMTIFCNLDVWRILAKMNS
jgi:hypothetical protein